MNKGTHTSRRIDITGRRFDRLFVVRSHGVVNGVERWLCRCDCGGEKIARSGALRGGNTRSCGCLNSENRRFSTRKHGAYRTKTYWVWQAMKDRCCNPRSPVFHYYGGRGIKVCARWLESFQNFLTDMGEAPDGLQLDRIDNDGDYEPENCRWATVAEQHSNTRRNIQITINGATRTVTEWSKELGVIGKHTALDRIRRGWDPVVALTTPSMRVGARGP